MLRSKRYLSGKLAKYQIVLQEFDDDIFYRPGRKNIVCDTLSRYFPSMNSVPGTKISDLQMGQIRDEQHKCTWISHIKELLRRCQKDERTNEYLLMNDVLYKIPARLHQDFQLVIPEDSGLKTTLIAIAHASPTGTSHQGIKKTHSLIEKFAVWNNMKQDVHNFILTCLQCQKRKDPSAYRDTEPLQPIDVATRPWQRVQSDIVGPLPLTLLGNKIIVVFVDAFSKFIIAEPIADQKALTTAEVFTNRFMARFGLPEVLVTDQGTNYTSEIFSNLLRQFGITHRTSTPYHHQSNGQVERANRTLQELITIATQQHSDTWDDVLHLITHSYNCAENATTRFSPHFLIHGREPSNVFHLALRLPRRNFTNEEVYVNHLTGLLQDVWTETSNNAARAQQQQKHHYDLRKRTSRRTYETRDKILVRKDGTNKLSTRFDGPFHVIKMDHPNVTIQDGRRKRTIHINRTKPFNATDDDLEHP